MEAVSRPYRDYDRLVVGAGTFGLHAAALLLRRGHRVAVLDIDTGPLLRASLVNQARLHNGYHYPRSAYTALRSAGYYDQFVRDFPDTVNARFSKVYAIAAHGSYTDAAHFEGFCDHVGIPAQPVDPSAWFRPGAVEAAYLTDEYSFDAPALRSALLARVAAAGACDWFYGDSVTEAHRDGDAWGVRLASGARLSVAGVVNATYAGTNALLQTFGLDPLQLKYELCEVSLVDAPAHRDVGITVMDGPFFSLMPFGHSGMHTLTAVEYTPRRVGGPGSLPTFGCQADNPCCTPAALDNCASCPVRPVSAYPQMLALAARFLSDTARVRQVEAVHSVKTVLRTSEVDDGRPTLVREHLAQPLFVSLFSGKINTIYDLEQVL